MRLQVATGLVLVTLAATAAAGPTYPACTKKPTPEADMQAAKGLHTAAEQYYAKGRYEDAVRSWRDAYNFDCNAHRLLINIGNAYEKLAKLPQAIEAFETYVARIGPGAEQDILDKIAALKQRLKDSGKGGSGGTQTPYDTGGGAGGGGGGGQGGTDVKVPDPDPPDEPGKPIPVLTWAGLGAGVALGVLGGVLIGVGSGKISAGEAVCGHLPDDPGVGPNGESVDPARSCQYEVDQGKVTPEQATQAIDDGSTGRTLQGVGIGSLVLGVAAIAGGIVYWRMYEPAQGDKASALRLTPVVGPTLSGRGGRAGLLLHGSF